MTLRGRIFICGILLACLVALFPGGPLTGAERTPAGSPFLDEELNVFLGAKDFIFEREWARAVNAFKGYLRAYPTGRYCREAGFWLAKALDGLAGEERMIERVLDRKIEAVEVLDRLEKEGPKSPWSEEARLFRNGLLKEIALVGGERKRSFLAGFLKEEGKTLDQARLDGLDALLSWDRGWAAAVIEDLLKTVADPEGRKAVIRFAVRFFPDETEALLRDASERDADAGVRAEAVSALERLEMARLPVDALYFIFTARLTDAAAQAMLPEMDAKIFDLAPASDLNNKDAEKKADRFFRGKLRRLKMKGGGIIDEDWGERMSWIRDLLDEAPGHRLTNGKRVVVGALSEKTLRSRFDLSRLRQRLSKAGEGSAVMIPVGDVTISFPLAGYKKTADSFSGRIFFAFGDRKATADFSVDSRRGQLAAFRRGNDVWLVVLQFDATAAERPGFLGSRHRRRSPLVFQNVLGCQVESSRGSWSLEEMRRGGMIDFGRAKVVIPARSGRWRLEGFLQADMERKVFVGRNAELFDDAGKRVAQAAEIVVPAGAPDKYEVIRK